MGMMLQELMDILSVEFFGKTKAQAISEGVCLECGGDHKLNCYSDAGLKEYQISALCEKCFDAIADTFPETEEMKGYEMEEEEEPPF